MAEEYIICSAIWFDDKEQHVHQPKNIDTGFVIAGLRHPNCFITLAIISNETQAHLKYNKKQGFITNQNRFVDRKEAAQIAYDANQVKEELKELHSEHLY